MIASADAQTFWPLKVQPSLSLISPFLLVRVGLIAQEMELEVGEGLGLLIHTASSLPLRTISTSNPLRF